MSDCLLYTSDAADEARSVDLGGRRISKKKTCKSFSSLVAFLAACLTSWQHQLRALFELTEEMFTKTAGDRRQFMIEELTILLWIICQIELLSISK